MPKLPKPTNLAEKCPSEGNIDQASTEVTTPPSFVFLRGNKREREEEHDLFKDEIRDMMGKLLSDQETVLKKYFAPILSEIQSTNKNIETSIALLTSQNEELAKKVELLDQQQKKDKEVISILENRIEDIQRAVRKNNIEIKNVPKGRTETKEDLINMVMKLGTSIDYNIKKSEIKDIYRVRGKKEGQSNTPIVVELSSTVLKTDVLKMSKAHNRRHNNKLCAKHLGFTKNEDTPIFVSEQLTVKASRLYFLARDLAKSKGYKFCWTAYGRVYVRKDETSPIITIHSEAQVNALLNST